MLVYVKDTNNSIGVDLDVIVFINIPDVEDVSAAVRSSDC